MIPTNAGHYYYVKGSDEQNNRDFGRQLDNADIYTLLGQENTASPTKRRRKLCQDLISRIFEVKGASFVDLKTVYPGLIFGSGNLHPIADDSGNFQNGFTFDWTTGLPVIPGSSVKGVIRSVFPKINEDRIIKDSKIDYIINLVRTILNGENGENENNRDINSEFVNSFEQELFEKQDVFHDAFIFRFPISGLIFAEDYITPHKKPLQDPVPLRILKITSNIVFRFQFVPKQSSINNITITTAAKLKFYEQVLKDFGIGAKRKYFGELVQS